MLCKIDEVGKGILMKIRGEENKYKRFLWASLKTPGAYTKIIN